MVYYDNNFERGMHKVQESCRKVYIVVKDDLTPTILNPMFCSRIIAEWLDHLTLVQREVGLKLPSDPRHGSQGAHAQPVKCAGVKLWVLGLLPAIACSIKHTGNNYIHLK